MNGYMICDGDPDADRRDVLELGRYLPDLTEARYAKYYKAHPLGSTRFVLVRLSDSPKAVGMAALFPATLQVAGRPMLCGIAGGLVVDPSHRSLGPALVLARHLLAHLPTSDLRFVYALPNQTAEPVFRRVGYTQVGRMTRFVKVLRSEYAIRARLAKPKLAKAAAKVLDVGLSAAGRDSWRTSSSSYAFEPLTQFDERFSPLLTAVSKRHAVIGERTPELLNWKYETDRADSRRKFDLLVARQGNSICGYAVSLDRDDIRHVVDLLFDSRSALDGLLRELTQRARRDKVSALCVDYFGPRDELTTRLRAFGFLRRTARPVMISCRDDQALPELAKPENWWLLGGDEDI